MSAAISADSSLYFDIGIQLWFYQAEMVGADEGAPDADVVWKPTIEFMDSIEVRVHRRWQPLLPNVVQCADICVAGGRGRLP